MQLCLELYCIKTVAHTHAACINAATTAFPEQQNLAGYQQQV